MLSLASVGAMHAIEVTSASAKDVRLSVSGVEVVSEEPAQVQVKDPGPSGIQLSAMHEHIKLRHSLKNMLQAADKNKDGKIAVEELVTIMESTLEARKTSKMYKKVIYLKSSNIPRFAEKLSRVR